MSAVLIPLTCWFYSPASIVAESCSKHLYLIHCHLQLQRISLDSHSLCYRSLSHSLCDSIWFWPILGSPSLWPANFAAAAADAAAVDVVVAAVARNTIEQHSFERLLGSYLVAEWFLLDPNTYIFGYLHFYYLYYCCDSVAQAHLFDLQPTANSHHYHLVNCAK